MPCRAYIISQVMHSERAIVIGSGIAGLAVAIRLAVQGYQVTVYERNNYPGGKLALVENEGYQFDAGPSLFTQPANIEELFALAGEPIEEYFSYRPLDIACRYFYENGKRVTAYTDPVAFGSEMEKQLGEPPANLLRYLKDAERLYEHTGKVFLEHSLHKRSTWIHRRIWKALKATKWSHLFRSLDMHNRANFTTPEAAQLFDRFATYNGSSPYKAPAMLSMIPHLEQNQGTFYPSGGMISIATALYKLAIKKGVQFIFNTPVDSIIHHEGRVNGVVVKGENIRAELVISNVDSYFTYRHLLQNPFEARRILKQERSSSAIIFYWGIAATFPQLHLHNIFFSANYKREFEHLFDYQRLFDDPTVYINITSKIDQGHAPEGKENWFVMINAPADTGQNQEEQIAHARKNILAKLSRLLQTEIEPLIETETVLDPAGIEAATRSYKGSLYGTSSNARLAAFLRHPNFTGKIKGLFFCGGSVHPGGGIPLCLKSAQIVSNLVQQQKPTHH